MQIEQIEMRDRAINTLGQFTAPLKSADPRTVLEEVFELLEDYGPVFYTEELHNKIVAALLPKGM